MNRKLLALLMAAITLPVAAAQYVKPGAVLTLNPGKGNAEFNINASTRDGSGVCNMDGTAQQIARSIDGYGMTIPANVLQ